MGFQTYLWLATQFLKSLVKVEPFILLFAGDEEILR